MLCFIIYFQQDCLWFSTVPDLGLGTRRKVFRSARDQFPWLGVRYLPLLQCFALYLRFANKPIAAPRGRFDTFPPIILYAAMGINVLVDFAVTSDRVVTDVTGIVWHLTGIVGPMSVVTLFTMVFVAILASHRAADHAAMPSETRHDRVLPLKSDSILTVLKTKWREPMSFCFSRSAGCINPITLSGVPALGPSWKPAEQGARPLLEQQNSG
jgi:hypothetical protein